MSRKRLAVAMIVAVAALGVLMLYVNRREAERRHGADGVPASPAATETPQPQTEPARADQADAPAEDAPDQPLAAPARTDAEEPATPTDESDEQPPADEPEDQPSVAATTPNGRPAGDGRQRWYWKRARRPERVVLGSLAPPPGDQEEPPPGWVFRVELTSTGAAIESVRLANHFETIADKLAYDDDPQDYARLVREHPGKYKGHYELLSAMKSGAVRQLPLATRRLVLTRTDEEGAVRTHKWNIAGYNWIPVDAPDDVGDSAQAARFELTLHRGTSPAAARPICRLVKTYVVRKDDYSIDVSLEIENLSEASWHVGVDQAGPTAMKREDVRMDMRQGIYGWFSPADEITEVQHKPHEELASVKAGHRWYLGSSEMNTPMLWVGTTNKFFGSMMYLHPALDVDRLSAPEWKSRFYLEASAGGSGKGFLGVVLLGIEPGSGDASAGEKATVRMESGQSKTARFNVFAGPKKRELFTDPGSPYYRPLYEKLNYISALSFRSCFCMSSWLALKMMALLGILATVALGNYGVGIILLVVLVRLVLHPLTKRGQVSMSRMQKLGPQMQKLKEKYADDKDTLNKEMMRLYKQGGATPILGCLPMVLQMPIWIALWTGLNASVELRHAAFLPVWITDLSAPDALISWQNAVNIPLVGPVASFNLLPILLAIAMFLQTRLNPSMAGQTPGSDQAKQQKMMAYMMPAMMLLFFYNAPSGLNLYIMTSTFAGVGEQYVIRKHIREKEAAEAARETTVKVPGKAPRGSRAKKPKGAFWMKKG